MTNETETETSHSTGMMNEGDFLAHFGKKGMKWGVRNDGTPISKGDAIREARQRAGAEELKITSALQTGATRVNDKYNASHKEILETRAKGAAAVGKIYNTKMQTLLASDDVKLGRKATPGEKAQVAVALGVVSAFTVGSFLLAARG